MWIDNIPISKVTIKKVKKRRTSFVPSYTFRTLLNILLHEVLQIRMRITNLTLIADSGEDVDHVMHGNGILQRETVHSKFHFTPKCFLPIIYGANFKCSHDKFHQGLEHIV